MTESLAPSSGTNVYTRHWHATRRAQMLLKSSNRIIRNGLGVLAKRLPLDGDEPREKISVTCTDVSRERGCGGGGGGGGIGVLCVVMARSFYGHGKNVRAPSPVRSLTTAVAH